MTDMLTDYAIIGGAVVLCIVLAVVVGLLWPSKHPMYKRPRGKPEL